MGVSSLSDSLLRVIVCLKRHILLSFDSAVSFYSRAPAFNLNVFLLYKSTADLVKHT